MTNAGKYRADNRIAINNVAELNLIVDALQDKMAGYIKAAVRLEERGHPMERTMRLKAAATSNLLDRLRVGWKGVDPIPEEIQQQLASREDKRFWTNIQTRMDEIELELAAGVQEDLTCVNLYAIPR